MKVVLHIDRLVLRGVAAQERDALVAHLRRTLEVELSKPGVAARLAVQGDRDALRSRFVSQTPAAAGGRAAAVAIAKGLAP